jgi:hypothetical protein
MFQMIYFSEKKRLLKYEVSSNSFGVWELCLDLVVLFVKDINSLQVDIATQVKSGVVIKINSGSSASLLRILIYSQ